MKGTSSSLLDTGDLLEQIRVFFGIKSTSRLLRALIRHAWKEWQAGNAAWLEEELQGDKTGL